MTRSDVPQPAHPHPEIDEFIAKVDDILPPEEGARMATVDEFLARCVGHIGTTETPPGSNCNPFSKALGRPCEAWCADAMAAIANETGVEFPSGSAYTPTMADGFRLAGRWAHTPAPGHIAFFDFPDHTTGIQHVGVVKADLGGGQVATYEGNTSSGLHGSQDNGDGFYEKTRPTVYIVGYGIPPWANAPPAVGPGARIVDSNEELELGTIAVRPQGGFVVIGHDGGVFTYDGAPYHGSIPEHPEWNVGANVVGAAWTPSGEGYWITTRDGAVFSFGDAQYHGGFNGLDAATRGARYVIGLVSAGSGYKQVAFDPSRDGSPYDEYAFGT